MKPFYNLKNLATTKLGRVLCQRFEHGRGQGNLNQSFKGGRKDGGLDISPPVHRAFQFTRKSRKRKKEAISMQEFGKEKSYSRKREMTLVNLTTWDCVEQIGEGVKSVDGASLYRAFEQIKDGRKEKGKRYPLALILTLVILGKMAGEKTISGIRDWVKGRKKDLKMQLNWPKGFPAHCTYTNALAHCDGQEIAKALAQVIIKARAEEKYGAETGRLVAKEQEEENLIHTAMDGKTLRGTLGHASEEQPPVHLLSLYERDPWDCHRTRNS